MAWETPKTNWHGTTDASGNYVGDRFNAVDFNRIKNNLTYLRELAIKLYEEFFIVSLGADRTPVNYFYADEINQLEENLETVNTNTLRRSYGSAPVYVDNGNTPDFNELNRLERAILDLYDRLTNEFEGRRMFTWNFGMKGGGL
ncbi:MAG: hypothetical protein LBN40_04480 [Oscillospiraceae bacterium]|jgi:hypothetical protein|nr:hypothetical protein [Oscillospiraceae bacterium]